MKILGIETSCDETAASVVTDGKWLVSNVVASSMDLHVNYGGVVPEIAARSHIEAIIPVINEALDPLNGSTLEDKWKNIDGIAVTYGAGLGGSLLIGVMTARTLAMTLNKPLYAINHVEGHVYANFLSGISEDLRDGAVHNELLALEFPKQQPKFPMLAVIVSGGHSQLALFYDHFDYILLGQTQDDAIGEAFDKVAKILGLPYPGGPSVSRLALQGNSKAFELPKAKMGNRRVKNEKYGSGKKTLQKMDKDAEHRTEAEYTKSNHETALYAIIESGKYDFSFSGLKTAVLRLAQSLIGETYDFPSYLLPDRLNMRQKQDIAASFERVAIETIVDKVRMAYDEFKPSSVVIAGGVAANQELRRQLSDALPLPIEYPDIKLCTDNGAMIATLGCYKAMLGQSEADPYTLAIKPNLSM